MRLSVHFSFSLLYINILVVSKSVIKLSYAVLSLCFVSRKVRRAFSHKLTQKWTGGVIDCTFRELFRLKKGGLIIDTPGMRELQLYGSETSLKETFEDIESLSKFCKFSNCHHISEPGCAVLEAIKNGSFERNRLESFRKLQRELHFASQKNNIQNNDKKQRSKVISKLQKQFKKREAYY